MTKTTIGTEWLVTFDDCHTNEKEFHFEVSSEWLSELLTGWAVEDAANVENDVETYIRGRRSHLYEEVCTDFNLANDVYDIASEQGVIINCKEVNTQKNKIRMEKMIMREAISKQIENGYSEGEKWELEIEINVWENLTDEELKDIAKQVREGETSNYDPCGWTLYIQ